MLTCCRGSQREAPNLVQALVVFPPRDSIRFSLPVTTQRCSDGTSFVLNAAGPDGNGVLMRVRYRDSLVAGTYPVATPDDTGKRPAAVVAVRYLVRETPRAFVVDSGTIEITREGRTLGAHVRGTGVESAIRTPTRIEYHNVPLPARTDTVTCGYQP